MEPRQVAGLGAGDDDARDKIAPGARGGRKNQFNILPLADGLEYVTTIFRFIDSI